MNKTTLQHYLGIDLTPNTHHERIVSAVGYAYIITPVLVNTVTILGVAMLFNYFFKWRRYPSYLTLKHGKSTTDTYGPIKHADLVYALSEMDSFIDVTEDDLLRIYQLATGRNVAASDESNKQ